MRNTSRIGEACVIHVMSALHKQDPNRIILAPIGDSNRYDFVVEEADGRFNRIQCKNARLTNGTVMFHACSVDSRSEKGRCIRKGYQGQIEFFGAYCPANDKVYLVPIEKVTGSHFFMRIDPPRNNQLKGINWARDYEIGSVSTVGTYSGLSIPEEVVKLFID